MDNEAEIETVENDEEESVVIVEREDTMKERAGMDESTRKSTEEDTSMEDSTDAEEKDNNKSDKATEKECTICASGELCVDKAGKCNEMYRCCICGGNMHEACALSSRNGFEYVFKENKCIKDKKEQDKEGKEQQELEEKAEKENKEKENEEKEKRNNEKRNEEFGTTQITTTSTSTSTFTQSTETIKKTPPTKTLYSATNPHMTKEIYTKWSLAEPPPLVHSFWIHHPKVILWAMTHWVLEGYDVKVKIPHRWVTVGFRMQWWDGPESPKKHDKSKPLNMIDVIRTCKKILDTKTNFYRRARDEKSIIYPKIIVDVRSELESIEIVIKDIQNDILRIDKQIQRMKYRARAGSSNNLDPLDEMMQMQKMYTNNMTRNKRIRTKLRTEEIDIYTEVCARVSEMENKYCSTMEEEDKRLEIQ